jgi:hypothetical protein
MGQLARCGSEFSRSAGAWATASASMADDIDETLSDGTATEFGSPSTIGTHTVILPIGTNWDGNPLVAPGTTADHICVVHTRFLTGAVGIVIDLVEDVASNGFATLRATFGASTGLAGTYKEYRYKLTGPEAASIVNPANLAYRFVITVGTAGRRGLCTWATFELPSPAGTPLAYWSESFAGLSTLPRWWTQNPTGTNDVKPPVIITNGQIRFDTAYSSILTNHRADLPADCYAACTLGADYNAANTGVGAFVRQPRAWTQHGTDGYRYNNVNNTPAAQHELKLDGGTPGVAIASVAFATVPNMATGDVSQTRAIGTTITARKNGTQIMTGTDASVAAAGHAGIVVTSGFGGTNYGPSAFEMGSTTPPASTGGSFAHARWRARRRRA